MLTDFQRQLFGQLVDVAWEMDQEYPPIVKTALSTQYWKVQEELMEDMGTENYIEYVSKMRQMFAPAK